MITACTRLLRGSGYVGFDGEVPADPIHAALASEYAHVTAPLRRLGDRYAGEICVALCAGTEVPAWVLATLRELPDDDAGLRPPGRTSTRRRSSTWSRPGSCSTGWGRPSTAVVVDVDEKDDTRGKITIQDPAVEARVTAAAPLPLGTEAEVRLTQADVDSRSVVFQID